MANVTIKIPTTANPYEVWVNGVKYSYEAGKTVDVPEEVAVVIQQHIKALEEGLLPPAPGDGGSTALGGADWNAAEGEAGHVLNRTHWVEQSYGEILPETAVSVTTDEPVAVLLEPVVELIEGEEYTVTWNGVEYKCEAQIYEDEGVVVQVLGNFDLYLGKGDSGEPFALGFFTEASVALSGYAAMVMVFEDSTSATFSVSGPTEIVYPLDKKFLPDMGSSGNAAMVVDFEITDSGLSISKNYDAIRAHIEAGGLAYVRFPHNYNNVETTNLYPLFQMTETELKFRCLIIYSLSLHVQTIVIDNTNAVMLTTSMINIDSVD